MAKLSSQLSVEEVLGAEGIIASVIPGFQTRQSQLEMAELIDRSMHDKQHCVIEASTGIGKSFAYLVPTFLSKKKVVISTGTKNLQDQLYKKDLPLINKTIISGKKIALLKGRSNYCCPHRINIYRQQRRFQGRNMVALFDTLKQWSESTVSGDIAEFAEIPENDSLWFYATSTSDNCLGSECPEFSCCFVMKARRKAQEADVIVINHHLFFSDQALKEEGFGELLPEVDVLIFDEAHQLPDVASHFFSRSLTRRQLDLLLKDIIDAQLSEARESKEIQDFCQLHQKSLDDFRLVLGKFTNKSDWRNIQHAPDVVQGVADIQASLQKLMEQLETIKSRGKDLASCYSRLEAMQQTLNEFLQPQEAFVSWYEWNERSFRLMQSPLEVSDQFSRQLNRNDYQSVLFTSATLSANNTFDYFTQRLGLDDIKCAQFQSSFNYAEQAMLYLPESLPDPSSDQFAEAFIKECVTLIEATRGNCFILFTSYRMLTYSARILADRVSNKLFVQGEKQRSELLHAYMQAPDSVLLGTSSFWEGVDVKGEKLKLVIIDKLPFKSPGDPVYKQRLQLVNKLGGNAFLDVQVPEATISLRQGVGRLIRGTQDRGIVMIADNRIRRKPYGKNMLRSLPEMKVSSSQSEILEFAAKL